MLQKYKPGAEPVTSRAVHSRRQLLFKERAAARSSGGDRAAVVVVVLLCFPPPLSGRSRSAQEGPVGGPQGRHDVVASHVLQAGRDGALRV